jgi:hypothetical protein
MNADMRILLIVAVIALVIGLIILGAVSAAKRRKALLAWCQANGLQFNQARSSEPGTRFPLVDVMQAGHSRYGANWCTGQWQGRPLCYFDYHYTTGSGKNETSYSLSILTIESPTPLKPLTIRPEGLLDKVGEFFGAQEIHFESAEFNRRFHVKCEDRKWAYDALPPQTLELLLSSPRKLHVQFDHQAVAIWDGSIWQPEEIDRAARIAAGLLDLMPQFAAREAMK